MSDSEASDTSDEDRSTATPEKVPSSEEVNSSDEEGLARRAERHRQRDMEQRISAELEQMEKEVQQRLQQSREESENNDKPLSEAHLRARSNWQRALARVVALIAAGGGVSHGQKLAFAQSHYLFSKIAKDKQQLLIQSMRKITLPKGAYLYKQGDYPFLVYFITSGVCRVSSSISRLDGTAVLHSDLSPTAAQHRHIVIHPDGEPEYKEERVLPQTEMKQPHQHKRKRRHKHRSDDDATAVLSSTEVAAAAFKPPAQVYKPPPVKTIAQAIGNAPGSNFPPTKVEEVPRHEKHLPVVAKGWYATPPVPSLNKTFNPTSMIAGQNGPATLDVQLYDLAAPNCVGEKEALRRVSLRDCSVQVCSHGQEEFQVYAVRRAVFRQVTKGNIAKLFETQLEAKEHLRDQRVDFALRKMKEKAFIGRREPSRLKQSAFAQRALERMHQVAKIRSHVEQTAFEELRQQRAEQESVIVKSQLEKMRKPMFGPAPPSTSRSVRAPQTSRTARNHTQSADSSARQNNRPSTAGAKRSPLEEGKVFDPASISIPLQYEADHPPLFRPPHSEIEHEQAHVNFLHNQAALEYAEYTAALQRAQRKQRRILLKEKGDQYKYGFKKALINKQSRMPKLDAFGNVVTKKRKSDDKRKGGRRMWNAATQQWEYAAVDDKHPNDDDEDSGYSDEDEDDIAAAVWHAFPHAYAEAQWSIYKLDREEIDPYRKEGVIPNDPLMSPKRKRDLELLDKERQKQRLKQNSIQSASEKMHDRVHQALAAHDAMLERLIISSPYAGATPGQGQRQGSGSSSTTTSSPQSAHGSRPRTPGIGSPRVFQFDVRADDQNENEEEQFTGLQGYDFPPPEPLPSNLPTSAVYVESRQEREKAMESKPGQIQQHSYSLHEPQAKIASGPSIVAPPHAHTGLNTNLYRKPVFSKPRSIVKGVTAPPVLANDPSHYAQLESYSSKSRVSAKTGKSKPPADAVHGVARIANSTSTPQAFQSVSLLRHLDSHYMRSTEVDPISYTGKWLFFHAPKPKEKVPSKRRTRPTKDWQPFSLPDEAAREKMGRKLMQVFQTSPLGLDVYYAPPPPLTSIVSYPKEGETVEIVETGGKTNVIEEWKHLMDAHRATDTASRASGGSGSSRPSSRSASRTESRGGSRPGSLPTSPRMGASRLSASASNSIASSPLHMDTYTKKAAEAFFQREEKNNPEMDKTEAAPAENDTLPPDSQPPAVVSRTASLTLGATSPSLPPARQLHATRPASAVIARARPHIRHPSFEQKNKAYTFRAGFSDLERKVGTSSVQNQSKDWELEKLRRGRLDTRAKANAIGLEHFIPAPTLVEESNENVETEQLDLEVNADETNEHASEAMSEAGESLGEKEEDDEEAQHAEAVESAASSPQDDARAHLESSSELASEAPAQPSVQFPAEAYDEAMQHTNQELAPETASFQSESEQRASTMRNIRTRLLTSTHDVIENELRTFYPPEHASKVRLKNSVEITPHSHLHESVHARNPQVHLPAHSPDKLPASKKGTSIFRPAESSPEEEDEEEPKLSHRRSDSLSILLDATAERAAEQAILLLDAESSGNATAKADARLPQEQSALFERPFGAPPVSQQMSPTAQSRALAGSSFSPLIGAMPSTGMPESPSDLHFDAEVFQHVLRAAAEAKEQDFQSFDSRRTLVSVVRKSMADSIAPKDSAPALGTTHPYPPKHRASASISSSQSHAYVYGERNAHAQNALKLLAAKHGDEADQHNHHKGSLTGRRHVALSTAQARANSLLVQLQGFTVKRAPVKVKAVSQSRAYEDFGHYSRLKRGEAFEG